jgi:Kef-type K+ transport system membrane component KefB
MTGAFIAGPSFGRSHLRDEVERHMHSIKNVVVGLLTG